MNKYSIVTLFLFSVFLFVLTATTASWVPAMVSLVAVLCFGWVIFGNSMNLVQNLGSLYWIIRDNAKKGDRWVSSAFMRQTENPWLIGKGVQVRFFKYVVQVGVCYPSFFDNEEEGVLNAMTGRYMEDNAKEIGNWK